MVVYCMSLLYCNSHLCCYHPCSEGGIIDLHAWARSLLFFVVDCLSVFSSICHGQTSNWFFFFVSRWNWAIFWLSFPHDPSTERCSSSFDLGPLMPQNLLSKIACGNAKLPRRHPWSRTRQFSSCLEKVGNPLNFGADHCCHGNEIWHRRGDLDAYRLVFSVVSVCVCRHHPMVKREDKFENGYIEVCGWWFNIYDILVWYCRWIISTDGLKDTILARLWLLTQQHVFVYFC